MVRCGESPGRGRDKNEQDTRYFEMTRGLLCVYPHIRNVATYSSSKSERRTARLPSFLPGPEFKIMGVNAPRIQQAEQVMMLREVRGIDN